LSRNSHIIDIYSNSWGPIDDGRRLEGPGPLTESALENGVTSGRSGLGTIYVWAGGNGGLSGDNSNYDGYTNSRFTIAVAAFTNLGDKAEYSENGANILVTEPSSGGTLGIVTTGRDNSYTTDFGGTSSSTPLVSGIIALMLEANPNLTWRDVQHILVKTAAQIDAEDPDWTVNGAGSHINHKYGFGRIDAQAAVDTALTWTPVGPENPIPVEMISRPNLPIPDNNTTGVSDTILITNSITVESVDIFFTAADHLRWGDLEITLISPQGTESILAEDHYTGISLTTYDDWRFGSVRHFGEASEGTWTLRIRDLRPSFTGTFEQWTLRLHGTSNQGLGGGGGGCFIKTSGLSGSRVRP
jgi:kexin